MALHDVILRSKAELDQFCEGLKSCGVLSAVRQYSDLTRKYFSVDGRQKLTSGMFNVVYHFICVSVTTISVCMHGTCTCTSIYSMLCTLCYSSSAWNFQKHHAVTLSRALIVEKKRRTHLPCLLTTSMNVKRVSIYN